MATRFVENRAGIQAMLRSPAMFDALEKVAGEPIKARAEALTPVKSGRMKQSWRVTRHVVGGRAVIRVRNIARSEAGYNYPAALERGNRRIERRRILGRALDAIANR